VIEGNPISSTVYRDVLYDDLLLASPSMVVEPFGQHQNRSRSLVSKLQIFRSSLEIFRGLRPALPVHGQGCFISGYQLADEHRLNRISLTGKRRVPWN
jgi:hypothetical protein